MNRMLLALALAFLLPLLPGTASALPVEPADREGPPQDLLDLLMEGAEGEEVAEFAKTSLGNGPSAESDGIPMTAESAESGLAPSDPPGKPDLVVPPGPPARAGTRVGPPATTPPDVTGGTLPVGPPAVVPEPGTALLFGAGLGGLAAAGRRRRTG